MSTAEGVLNFTFAPLRFIFWLLALPLRLLAYIIRHLKAYDPERLVCPACGFKGDSGTGKKSCRIKLVGVRGGVQEVMLRHTCFRCDASFYTKTVADSREWYRPPAAVSKEEKVKEIIKNGVI